MSTQELLEEYLNRPYETADTPPAWERMSKQQKLSYLSNQLQRLTGEYNDKVRSISVVSGNSEQSTPVEGGPDPLHS